MGKAATAAPEVDKAATKKMFAKAKKKQVGCALAVANQGGGMLIVMHKSKHDRGMVPVIEKEFGKKDIKDIRFGSAFIDKAEDPKLVIIDINRALAGAARKLKKALKGTGVSKVRILVGGKVDEEMVEVEPGDEDEPEIPDDDEDDGDEVDETETEDAADEDEGEELQSQDTNQSVDPSQSTEPNQSTQPAVDFQALATRLTAVAKNAVEVMKNEPGRQGEIRSMLLTAQGAIKDQNPDAASAIDMLEQELGMGAPSGDTPAPAFNEDGLKARLTEAVKKMMIAVKDDPSRGDQLKGLAQEATAALRNRDPGTESVIEQLETAIGAGNSNSNTPADASNDGDTPEQAPPGIDPQKHAALTASPKLWVDTMSTIKTGIDQLKDAIRKDLGDEAPEVLADVEKNLDKIDAVTKRFDKELADLLDAAAKATDQAQRANQLKEARKVLAAHIKYASTEPLIAMIDDNPFGVSPNIKNTLVTNLTQLASVVR